MKKILKNVYNILQYHGQQMAIHVDELRMWVFMKCDCTNGTTKRYHKNN